MIASFQLALKVLPVVRTFLHNLGVTVESFYVGSLVFRCVTENSAKIDEILDEKNEMYSKLHQIITNTLESQGDTRSANSLKKVYLCTNRILTSGKGTVHVRNIAWDIDYIDYLLKQMLHDSRWNVYNKKNTLCEKKLMHDEVKSRYLSRSGYRFINTKFFAMSESGELIPPSVHLTINNSWDSYGWKYQKICDLRLPEDTKRHLLFAHFGYTLSRKLAFDPLKISLEERF
jgi:hypothetical protein